MRLANPIDNPHTQDAPAPAPVPVPHAETRNPYPVGEQMQDWEKRLKTGGIDFNNPGTMVVGKETGIVVVINGYLDKSHSDLPGVTPQGALKVSDTMRVDLDAPLSPGEFQITPTHGATLPVRLDGYATWEFQVTPTNETSDPQTLVITPISSHPANTARNPCRIVPSPCR